MREITKYHDTSKTVKERAKNKLFGAHFYISGKLQYLYERSDIASFFYHSDLYFQ